MNRYGARGGRVRGEADLNDRAWIATPHIAPDHRGPVGRAFAPMPAPAAIGPAVAALTRIAAATPGAPAVVDGTAVTRFDALVAATARIAAALAGRPGGRFAILLPNGAAYVASVFAGLAAQRVSVLLDAAYPDARNAALAAAAGIDCLVTTAVLAPAIDWPGVTIVTVDSLLDGGPVPALPAATLDLDAPAFMLSTSGSSGAPKLIVHSQATMLHWARTTHNALHVTPADRALSLSSMSSLGGFTALLSYPLAGAAMQVHDLGAGGIGGLLDVLRQGRVTILRAAPSLLRGLARLPGVAAALAGLRIVQSYGEPLLLDDVAALRAVLPADCLIRTTYGSTEASGLSWFARADDAQDALRVPTGALMPDTEAAIVDAMGGDCARGETGELVIRSRYNGLGEWLDGRLVAARLPADADADASDPQARVYATGDLARCDADGVFVVVGRADRMLNLNGVRIEPAEIERALAGLPGVAEAEVVACRRGGADTLTGFVVAGGAPLDLPALKAALRGLLPAAMVPARLIALPALPRLPGGKVDTQALLALAGAA